MSQPPSDLSMLDLINGFYQQKINAADFEAGLKFHIQRCEKQQALLNQSKILPADQAQWEKTIKPGLDVCYEGLIGAAHEALEYAKSRNQELLPGILGLLQEVQGIMRFVEVKLGLVSAETQAAVQANLNPEGDGYSIKKASQGTAESQVSFLEDA